MDFEPFGDRPLTSLREPDLATLREVAEGWYVEYKREVPSAEAVAKSISAMANTYGGWVFYGVEEKSKAEAVAGGFPGVALAELDALLMRIRGAVAQGVNPPPHYDPHVIRAEGNGLLGEGRGVIVVRVPRSVNTPHLHRSGRVFRRVGDASEPAAETDRSRLDELFRRRDKLEQHYSDLFADTLTVPLEQSSAPMLRLMVVADLYGDRGTWISEPVATVREIMGRSTRDLSAMPFDSVHDGALGFVARQLTHNLPDLIGPTWELRRDLTSIITIPLRHRRIDQPYAFEEFLEGYECVDAFRDVLVRERHRTPSILDLNSLSSALVGLAHIQHELMTLAGRPGTVWFRAELIHTQGCVPFIDSPVMMRELAKHGAAMCMRSRLAVPPGQGLNAFIQTNAMDDDDEDHTLVPVLKMAWPMFIHLARALGLPTDIATSEEHGASYFDEIRDASNRYIAAQAIARRRLGE